MSSDAKGQQFFRKRRVRGARCEKHRVGEVASTGWILRGIVDTAGVGEPHLERSFYGRLNRQAA